MNMYEQVRTVLVNHQPLWENLPAFADSAENFFQLHDDLNVLKSAQRKKIKHLTELRDKLLKECIDEGHELIQVLKLHAIKTGDAEKILKFSISKNEFKYGRLQDKLDRLNDLAEDLQPVKTQLVVYGVDEVKIDAFEAKFSELNALSKTPREKIVDRHTITEMISEKNNAINSILHLELNVMMKQFKTTQAEFYRLYINARSIVDTKPHAKPKPLDHSPERDDGGF